MWKYQIKNFEKFLLSIFWIAKFNDRLNILFKNILNIKINNLNKNKELLRRLDIMAKYKINYHSLIESLENNSPINILKKGCCN